MAGSERALSAALASGFNTPDRAAYFQAQEAKAASSAAPVPYAPRRTSRDWFTKQLFLTVAGGFLGALSHGMFNRIRFRPTWHQPWFGVVQIAGGASFGGFLGRFYDDTDKELNRQYSESARLPSWMHGALSETELAVERRRETAAALRAKLRLLAETEEAEFLARRAEAAAAGDADAAAAAFEASVDDMVAAAGKAQAAQDALRAARAALQARVDAIMAKYESEAVAAGLIRGPEGREARLGAEAAELQERGKALRAAMAAGASSAAAEAPKAEAEAPKADVEAHKVEQTAAEAEQQKALDALAASMQAEIAAAGAEYQAVLAAHGLSRPRKQEASAEAKAKAEAAAKSMVQALRQARSDGPADPLTPERMAELMKTMKEQRSKFEAAKLM